MTADALSIPRPAARDRTATHRGAVVAALGVGAYMAALDISVVNAVLPVIADAFLADLSTIEWVITSYLLVQSALVLAFGRLGDLWGHGRVYRLGLAVFVASSVLCGLAGSTAFLVAGRAVQAIGASMMVANLAAIMLRVFPPEQRGRAVGIQATILYAGLATGAPLGGWLTGLLGWQSVFFVNVPLGVAALLLSWRSVPPDRPTERREPFDLLGASVYVAGLGLLLLGLNQGHAWGWTSPATLGSVLAGGLLLAGWVAIELRIPSPMLDLRLFRRPGFAAPIASNVLSYAAFAPTSFLVPFALIQGRGLSAAETGLILMGQPIVMALTASISGTLSDRVGTRAPATLGMLVVATGLFLLARQDAATPIELVAAVLLLTGLGIGLFTSPNSSAVLGSVPARQRGVASGILATARTLGMVLGIGIAGAVYATALGLTAATGPDAVLGSASVGLIVAGVLALLSAAASAAVRPRVAEADDA